MAFIKISTGQRFVSSSGSSAIVKEFTSGIKRSPEFLNLLLVRFPLYRKYHCTDKKPSNTYNECKYQIVLSLKYGFRIFKDDIAEYAK